MKRPQAALRLVLVDPDEPHDKPEPVSGRFQFTPRDLRRIANVLEGVTVPEGLRLELQVVRRRSAGSLPRINWRRF